MYVPAFFEIFLGFVVLMVWARFVLNRNGPELARWVPWIVGAALLIGQGVAAYGVLQTMGGAPLDTRAVWLGRWGSVGALAAGAVVLGIMTVMAFTSPRQPDA